MYQEKPDSGRVTKLQDGFISFTSIALIIVGFLYAAMVREGGACRLISRLGRLSGWPACVCRSDRHDMTTTTPPNSHPHPHTHNLRASASSSAGGTGPRRSTAPCSRTRRWPTSCRGTPRSPRLRPRRKFEVRRVGWKMYVFVVGQWRLEGWKKGKGRGRGRPFLSRKRLI